VVRDAAFVLLTVAGLLAATVGVVGVVRRCAPEVRLHAAGLLTVPAVLLLLAAAAVAGPGWPLAARAGVVALLLLATIPVSAHAILRTLARAPKAGADGVGAQRPGPEDGWVASADGRVDGA
jgi:multisubunit Na+/H+ antiporter MnhG subunit